jgi:ADP-heptose:LPS heptosyltransferase
MSVRPSSSRRLRKRLNRRFYGALVRGYRALFPTPSWPGKIPRSSLRRVLIVQHYGVGDMILTTPLIAFLEEQAPGVEIDVLASPRNAPVIAGDARLANVFVHDHTWRRGLSVLARLRARRYDAILSGQAGNGFVEGLTASLVAHARTYKISVWRPKRYHGLFSTVVRAPRTVTHTADRLLAMGRYALGLPNGTPGEAGARYSLRIASDARAEAQVDAFVREHALERGFVVVNLSAHFAIRDWPPDRCAVFVTLVLERHRDVPVVFTPAPGKTYLAREVAARFSGDRVVIAPELPLLALAALVRRATAVVTPNTALVHVASACRRPVVALYAPQAQGEVELWLPLGVPYRALASRVGGTIGEIAPERVADAMDGLLREIGSSTEAVAVPAGR